MCFGSKIAAPPPPPPPPQVARAPDTAPLRRRNGSGVGIAVTPGSTLLSGPAGDEMNLGGATLLGGG